MQLTVLEVNKICVQFHLLSSCRNDQFPFVVEASLTNWLLKENFANRFVLIKTLFW